MGGEWVMSSGLLHVARVFFDYSQYRIMGTLLSYLNTTSDWKVGRPGNEAGCR